MERPRQPGDLGPGRRTSLAIGADRLALRSRAQGPPGGLVDRVLDKLDAAIGEPQSPILQRDFPDPDSRIVSPRRQGFAVGGKGQRHDRSGVATQD
jgi:hypothetical protein